MPGVGAAVAAEAEVAAVVEAVAEVEVLSATWLVMPAASSHSPSFSSSAVWFKGWMLTLVLSVMLPIAS